MQNRSQGLSAIFIADIEKEGFDAVLECCTGMKDWKAGFYSECLEMPKMAI
jgi:hypothetical protein